MTDADFPPPRSGRFATTRWSLVLAAGGETDARSVEALSSLCELELVSDLTHSSGGRGTVPANRPTSRRSSFCGCWKRTISTALDPARGRFRGFLCASVRHFLSNERDRARSLKRGGARPPISLDVETAEGAINASRTTI